MIEGYPYFRKPSMFWVHWSPVFESCPYRPGQCSESVCRNPQVPLAHVLRLNERSGPILFLESASQDMKDSTVVWRCVARDIPNLLRNSDLTAVFWCSSGQYHSCWKHPDQGELIRLPNLSPISKLIQIGLRKIRNGWDCTLPYFQFVSPYFQWKSSLSSLSHISNEQLGLYLAMATRYILSPRSWSIRPLCGALRSGPIQLFWEDYPQNCQCAAVDVRFLKYV